MLTYELKKAPGMPLYESLYRCIRADILSGVLQPGQKLPSKRALSTHLEISKVTVEGAYDQLLAEGYIRSVEKVGYFVEKVEQTVPKTAVSAPPPEETREWIDLTGAGSVRFPFSVWARLQREVMLDMGQQLLQPLDNQGVWALRQAISEHLLAFRGMQVDPRQILIGAGTDFLYNLLVQLLGSSLCYGVEEPGYGKIRRIYAAAGASCVSAELDSYGVDPAGISNVQVLHISPNHHFPTGRVTPMSRRRELLQWLMQRPDRWIIEDDYDSEFRFNAHPMPAMQSLDKTGRVIYMNTFSRSLAPSIRISYMVLPETLMAQFQEKLGFYSCTVASFEQYTLARFLSGGFFEKHINRMRKFYKSRRDAMLKMVLQSPLKDRLTVLEEDAGLHFLVQVDTQITDRQLQQLCLKQGIRVYTLSSYFHGPGADRDTHCLVIHYAGISDEALQALENLLKQGISL